MEYRDTLLYLNTEMGLVIWCGQETHLSRLPMLILAELVSKPMCLVNAQTVAGPLERLSKSAFAWHIAMLRRRLPGIAIENLHGQGYRYRSEEYKSCGESS